MFFVMLASLLFVGGGQSFASAAKPSGDGLFSVAKGKQVRFASGNVVYDGRYHFAAHQYDYGGLFGWGTGSNPTLTSKDSNEYCTFNDWGKYLGRGWHTLTRNEWVYVIVDRADAAAKRGAATVCGVHGMVLLPDSWSGGTFNAGFDSFDSWNRNVYDASSWADMEAAGAVFLPAAGFRNGIEVKKVGEYGYYWSSTPYYKTRAFCMFYSDYFGHGVATASWVQGRSVRLVQDVN